MNEELKTRIMNRLQEKKDGQTLEQLVKYLKMTVETPIRVELHELLREGSVTQEKGVWSMVRQFPSK